MRVFSTFVLAVCAIVSCSGCTREPRAPVPTAAIHSPTARFALDRAVREAAQRLERPECGEVLSDFSDVDGRTIREKLEVTGETPRRYLTRIRFREVLDRRCDDSKRLAFAIVGSPDVFVCATQFWQQYQQYPSYVEALIIHEMMHTLGLRENPPSSMEINAKILNRCWARHR
jgi:hypothetical protein